MASKRPAKMTPKATAALDVYLKMGRDRTLVALTKLVKHSKSTIGGWSSRYEWTRRAAEHDHAALKEALGHREIDRELGTQDLVELIPEAIQTMREVMMDKGELPILNRQGEHAKDAAGNKLYKPTVQASTRLEAAKAVLGIAGLVPVKRVETVDRSGEQLDAAANVLAAMTPKQVKRLIEDLDDSSD